MVLSLSRFVDKVAIVTGASSGIGAAIVQKLTEEGLIVVGIARRVELIEDLSKKLSSAKGKLYAQKADLTSEEELLRAFEWTTKNLGPVHVLINNAGSARYGSLITGNTEDWKFIFNLNVLALSIATREAIKVMKRNDVDGHIIHINSTIGHRVKPFPGSSVYPASKFAVTALTETLRQELTALGSNIKITSVSPGLVESEITTQGKNITADRQAFFDVAAILKAEDVADSVVYALSTPKHVQVHELSIRAI